MTSHLADQITGLDITVSQSRFHKDTINDPASKDIEIRDLSLAFGKKELLSHANLYLQANTHYVLVARNGTGKSTLLYALAHGAIPGVPSGIKIIFIGQGSLELDHETNSMSIDKLTTLERVVKSDRYREQLLANRLALSAALQSSDMQLAPLRANRSLKLRDLRQELSVSAQVATYRSGARGFKARKDLKALELQVKEAEARLSQPEDEIEAETIATETSAAVERLAEIDAQLASIDAETAELRATKILKGLGFTEQMINGKHATLSGGWKTRASIACGLFQTSDVLLLDEPTNYLDLPAIIWLRDYVNGLSDKTVVVVTHDRDFADSISSTLLLLKDGVFNLFHGTLSSYMRETHKQARYFTKMKDAQEKTEQHLKQQISHHVQSARKSGDDKKLKQAASRKKKLDERMGLEVSAKGGRFKLNRDLPGYHTKNRADIDIPQFEPPVKLTIPSEPPDLKAVGNLITLEDASFTYRGAPKPTLRNANLAVGPRDRIGLVGLNGAGKSTLANLLMGAAPTSGSVQRNSRMRTACFAQQSVEDLERRGAGPDGPSLTPLAEVMRAARDAVPDGVPEVQARALLSGVGLAGRVASDVPVRALSGGQRVRVVLASLLVVPPHVLVLDEVTCHLDADTVTALAGALKAYCGAIVVVSHDRWFVRCVVEGEQGAADDDEGSDSDSDGNDGGGAGGGARKVLLVEKGLVNTLARGVQEYEDACEKRLLRMQKQ